MEPGGESIYYRHSGRIEIPGVILMAGLGLVAALLCGFLYGLIVWWNPFVYINFLGTFLLGGAVGYAVGLGGRLGKIRNPLLVGIVGLIVGLIAVYAGWMGWLFGLSGYEGVVLSPIGMLSIIGALGQEGVWTLFSWAPTGGTLYLIWLAEGGIIFLAAGAVAWFRVGSLPFCEQCQRWVKEKLELAPRSPVEGPDAMRSTLESGGIQELADLPLAEDPERHFTRIHLARCEGCEALHLLTAGAVTLTRNKDGEVNEQVDEIVENLLIDQDTYRAFLESDEQKLTEAASAEVETAD